MSAASWLSLVLFLCPAGAVIDRAEGDSLVVLGASGVRMVARTDVLPPPGRRARDGDRVVTGRDGVCRVVPPDPAVLQRVRDRLRALGAAPR